MTNKPTIVSLHDGRPSLNDIVGRLRMIADQIEAGEIPNVETCLVVIPDVGYTYPRMYGLGNVDNLNNPLIVLENAKLMYQQTYLLKDEIK
jgi:hypothetical protein